MSIHSGPNITTNGLIFYMDPTNIKSYPGTGTAYTDLTGNNSGVLQFTPGIGTMSYNPIFNCFDAQGATATSPTWISTTKTITFTDASAYTMEFAVKLKSGTLDTTFQSLCGNGQSNPWVVLVGSSTSWQLAFRQAGTADYCNSTMVNNYNLAENWALFTITVQTNRTVNFYLNGSLISAASPTPTTTLLNVSRLAGGYTSGFTSYPWQGFTSHIRFYNRLLSDSEILQNYYTTETSFRFEPNIVTSNLSFYIDTLNKNSFKNTNTGWTDMTGNYGTLSISGAYYDRLSGGISFDGAAGSSASNPVVFTQASEMTWDIWLNRTSSTNVFNMVFSNNNLPYLAFRPSNLFHFSWWATGTSTQINIFSPLSYLDNTWYNVVCTLKQDVSTSSSIANMYVNGLLVVTYTAPGSVDTINQSGALLIANYGSTPYPFNGKISNLKIYNRILTATEILQNFNAQKSRFGY